MVSPSSRGRFSLNIHAATFVISERACILFIRLFSGYGVTPSGHVFLTSNKCCLAFGATQGKLRLDPISITARILS
jgi:hypothetical protein